MKSKWFVVLLLTLMAQTLLGHQAKSFQSLVPISQESSWARNTDCGLPFWIALNVVLRNKPPSIRYIFVFIEPQNCTRENFRRIFLCLSQKYVQPGELAVTARSDKANLQRWINRILAVNSVRPDGSFERNKNHPPDLPEELQNEIGFYRADYYRSELVEDFSFSPDPNKEDRFVEVLKRRAIYAPTGDTISDLVRASLEEGLEDEVRKLLNKGADVNGRTKYGNTPLLAAVEMSNSKIVTLLLDRGADINQKDSDGWTPLMYSLVHGDEGIAEELLRRGADVNARADNGDTALIIATARGMAKIVRLLLSKGADVKVVDKFGRTPLMIAEEYQLQAIRDLLKEPAIKK